ncbi:MAG: GatB/YqeY domain-containing protein [Bacilli bacterium]|nr:GatB/YqeY domain-containing protein [Bacilli bacterium]
MRNQILEDLKIAMKNQDKERLSVIRMVKGSIQMAELNKKHELTDDEVFDVISKEIKSRKDSILEFEKGNRQDLIEKTQSEIDILKNYLPKQLTDDELFKLVDDVFEEVKPSSTKDMGKIMKLLKPKVVGKADMGFVSKVVKDKIEQL